MAGTFSPPQRVSDPDMHHGTCVTHVPWCMPGSLTSGFLWSRCRGKTFPAFPVFSLLTSGSPLGDGSVAVGCSGGDRAVAVTTIVFSIFGGCVCFFICVLNVYFIVCSVVHGWVRNDLIKMINQSMYHTESQWPQTNVVQSPWCLQQFPCLYISVTMSVMASQITSPAIVCSSVINSGAYQRKHQSSASLAFVWGIHRWPVISPHKGPVTRKMVPYDDVIMSFLNKWMTNSYNSEGHYLSLLLFALFASKRFCLQNAVKPTFQRSNYII